VKFGVLLTRNNRVLHRIAFDRNQHWDEGNRSPLGKKRLYNHLDRAQTQHQRFQYWGQWSIIVAAGGEATSKPLNHGLAGTKNLCYEGWNNCKHYRILLGGTIPIRSGPSPQVPGIGAYWVFKGVFKRGKHKNPRMCTAHWGNFSLGFEKKTVGPPLD